MPVSPAHSVSLSKIQPADLDLLASKAAANTSSPSNPREAGVDVFRTMFAAGLAQSCA
jgi:hypothetical protein